MVKNRTLGTAVVLGALGLAFHAGAQTNTSSTPRAIPNRYLVIVETSRAMHHRSAGTVAAVGELLRSGLSGQLRAGDSIGVWTFNSELHAGQFPLQVWLPTQAQEVTDRVQSFLATQKYSGQPHFEKILPVLHQVVAHSEFITIVLVTSGTQPLQGIPFEENLNKFYSTWRDQQQKAQMPFLAALRAEKGKLADYAVNVAPWKLELPALPPALLVAQAPRRTPAPARAAKPVMLPPLIISGKKPPVEPAAQSAQSVVSKPEQTPTAKMLAQGPSTQPANLAEQSATAPSGPVPPAANALATSDTRPGTVLGSNGGPAAGHAFEGSTVAPVAVPQKPLALSSEGNSSSAPTASTEVGNAATGNRAATPSPAAAPQSELPAAPAASVVASSSFTMPILRIGLLVLTVLLLAWMVRLWLTHSRDRAHTSLITRSLERK